MANRYWVGGTANWDGTAGTKWATTSGGAGGASVPTTADDVFFSALSTGTCTIAAGNTGAKSINCTGFTGTLTGTSDITVAGGITLVTGMTYSYTGIITFTGTGTLISASKSLASIIVSGAGITLTLGDALSCNGNFTVSEGNFNTANYSFTCAGSINSDTANLRSISLGSSTVTLTSGGIDFSPSTNLTFNAGTSQINLSSLASISSGGKTFYNVSYTGNTSGIRLISGSATFNNLTLTAPAASGVIELSIDQDLTVNGTLTCAGASSIRRNFIRSNAIGANRFITAAVVSANDCDFRDITIVGAAAPISPTRGGNCGGNSGITFPASKTVYRVGTNTSWAGSSSWATSSGGAGSDTNYPLPQDTAIIDNSTTLTGTLAVNGTNISALNCSSRTTGITLNFSTTNNIHGSFTLGSGITVSGTATQTFVNRSLINLVTAGKTITFPIEINAVGGTVQLGDAFNSNSSVSVDYGTFDANNYNVTCSVFVLSGATTRTVTMGSGLWTLTGTSSVWSASITTNLTFNKNTANILLSNTSTSARTFNPGDLAYNKLTIGGSTGTSTTTIGSGIGSGIFSFTELASTKTVAHTILFSSDIGTIDTWSITGTIGNVVTVNSTTTTRRNFYLTNATSGINYLSVSNIGELNGSKFAVGVNSTDGGNNFNVYFSALPQPPNTMFLMFY